MKTYKVARMDLVIGFATAFVFLIAVVSIIPGRSYGELPRPIVEVFSLVAILLSWLYAPKRYDLTDSALIIVRSWPFEDISVPLGDIRDIQRFNPYARTQYAWRLQRHSGGTFLFSSSGWSWSNWMGYYYRGYTNFHRAVLITAGKSYIISPENPDEFIADVQQAIGHQAPHPHEP